MQGAEQDLPQTCAEQSRSREGNMFNRAEPESGFGSFFSGYGCLTVTQPCLPARVRPIACPELAEGLLGCLSIFQLLEYEPATV